MRLATVKEVDIRCDLLVLLIAPLMLLFDALDKLLLFTLCLTLHEVSHTVVARALGYEIQSIEIQPFGFVARLKTKFYSCVSELVVALSGPVTSFFLGALGAAAAHFAPSLTEALKDFITYNIALGAINLIPALPLDGGRVFRALLSLVLRPRLATIITGILGIAVGVFLLGAGILLWGKAPNITVPMMGLFLVLGAVKEFRQLNSAHVGHMMRRSRALLSGEGLPLKQLVLHKSTTLSQAMHHLSPQKYNLIYVADDAMRILGQIDEQKLLWSIGKLGGDATILEALRSERSI